MVAPEYNYDDANGNSDYAALSLLGLEAISSAVIATGMDYNQPIKFVSGGHSGSAVLLGVIFQPLDNTYLSGRHFDAAVPFREHSGAANHEMMGIQGWHGLGRHHQGDINCIEG